MTLAAFASRTKVHFLSHQRLATKNTVLYQEWNPTCMSMDHASDLVARFWWFPVSQYDLSCKKRDFRPTLTRVVFVFLWGSKLNRIPRRFQWYQTYTLRMSHPKIIACFPSVRILFLHTVCDMIKGMSRNYCFWDIDLKWVQTLLFYTVFSLDKLLITMLN